MIYVLWFWLARSEALLGKDNGAPGRPCKPSRVIVPRALRLRLPAAMGDDGSRGPCWCGVHRHPDTEPRSPPARDQVTPRHKRTGNCSNSLRLTLFIDL
ncbi:hypothetical protein AAFF_G00108340 [Aldrovandia affinis]|uniref:Secreted protein n=1 Tax=Aldrovandia affinis TaxID=143900 RepID=A0AAD7RU53_9TELE|nr:hypothetical protein AAFF_G00108340 [Aldrovandia affinis]